MRTLPAALSLLLLSGPAFAQGIHPTGEGQTAKPADHPTSAREHRTKTPATPTDQSPAPAPETPAAWPRSRYAPLALDSPYASGDWLGLRTALEEAGLTTQFFLNNTYQWNVGGGRKIGSHHGATIDWLITADFEKMGWTLGGRGLIHVKREWGRGVNPFVGSVWQVQDDQDGDRELYIDQLWYERDLLEDQLSLRLGFLDFQTIFDRNKFSNSEDKHFMNQGLDNNPVLPLNIGLGASLTYRPCEWFSIITGVGDAQGSSHQPGFSTAFHDSARFVWFTEPTIHLSLPSLFDDGRLEGHYRFGVVYDPRSRPVFMTPNTPPEWRRSRGDDVGFYLSFDQKLYRENQTDQQGLGWFCRYSLRHGDIQRIQNFWSTGLVYQGLVPTRDHDLLGLAVLQSIPSRRFNDRVNRLAEAETVFECFYAIQITKWLVITPDLQYVSSPGIDSTLDDSLILGLRTRISF